MDTDTIVELSSYLLFEKGDMLWKQERHMLVARIPKRFCFVIVHISRPTENEKTGPA